MIKKILKFVLPLLFIVAGVLVAGWMINTRPVAERQEVPERITTVDVLIAERTEQTIIVPATGTVTPAKQVSLRPEVAGRVIDVDANLIPGGVFRSGEPMVKIDPRDYDFAVEARKEQLANATFQLKQERGQQAVALQEWELLEDSVPTTEEGKELALRKPQIERAEAAVKAARSALEQAELNVTRTVISAPFNAIVIDESVDVGQVIGSQSQIATLAGSDRFWVRVSIPVEDLKWIEVPRTVGRRGSDVRIVQESGSDTFTRDGYVVRLLGDLDNAGRLARILVAVDDPLLLNNSDNNSLPLLLGSFVSVRIEGETLEDIVVLPRKALRDTDESVAGQNLERAWVWIMNDEDRLEFRQIRIVWRTENYVYASEGLDSGERVVLSDIPTPIRDMKLTLNESSE